jgi:hypothetical protein
VRRPGIVLAAAALLVLVGCQRPAPPPQRVSPDLASQAVSALAGGDYGRAADLYRQALQREPESLPLHYGLAVAASHLDRKDEAIREFRWVLEHGREGSAEVATARGWLGRVGALPRPAAVARDGARATASLSGRALAAEGAETPPRPMSRLQLMLVGQPGGGAEEARYRLRTDEEGRFAFKDVPPGAYMLTNRMAGKPTWRLRVELGAGEDAVLDLTSANSVKVRDDFPERG